jgi:hypothetical protein
MTTLPMDRDNNPIPALGLNPNGAHIINATNTSARNTTAFDADTRVISLYAIDDVFIQFGDSNVTTTSAHHFLPKGLYYDFAIGGDKVMHMSHVAVIASDADCTVYISEKQ